MTIKTVKTVLYAGLLAAVHTSCDRTTKEQKAEDKLQAEHPYNHNVQGPGHETHENQFYVSRGKPALGQKMETAAEAGEPTEVKMAGDTLQNNK